MFVQIKSLGSCNTFFAKLSPYDSHFTLQELWLTFLNRTGFGKFFTKLKYLGYILAWKFIYRYILIIATFL